MKAFKMIKDPEAFRLLADETRRRIIYLLRAKEMTVSQIAAELNLTPQAIYHHIRKLRDSDLVEVAREERVDHFIETYYRATAEMFNLSHGEGMPQAYAEEKTKETLMALSRIGLSARTDPEVVTRIVELAKKMEQFGEQAEWVEKITGLEDVDYFVKQELVHLAKLLAMTDKEFTEYLNLEREYRKLVRSLIQEPKKVEALAHKS
ncbi:MAG: winged helix-turn-helix transcriptional regulator [Methanobacteriota archaeon]|nr:MAG: winged helix-turn-helix transcriptional regulator [Euryarchaeota archaeon]TLZ70151.1 MAG: winged helix-turn-helix transcriptional regulator [Euryarchaeota archaeon]